MIVEKKIVVFRKGGKLKRNFNWMTDNKSIGVFQVDNSNYLGITLNGNDNFHKTQILMYLPQSKKKGLNSLITKIQLLKLNVKTKLSYFDTYVRSLETMDVRFGGKKNTVSMMVYFELGRKPLYWNRNYRMLKYWLKKKLYHK